MIKNKIIAFATFATLASACIGGGLLTLNKNVNNENIKNHILLSAPDLNNLAVVINTNVSPLVLYNSPSFNSNVESYISVGEMLNYKATNNPNFYKVTVQETGACGYISADNMQIIESGLNKAYSNINKNGQIINVTTDVKLMSNPDVHSQILESYKNDTSITVLGKQDQWYKISVGGQTGYMYQSYVGIDASSNNENIAKASDKNTANISNPNKSTANVTNSDTNTNTGTFADILNNSKYMTASIDGTNIIIPFNKAEISNKQLIVPEYYTNHLDEPFTAKISSNENNNFTINEYYGDKNTAIMNLQYHKEKYKSYLSGTFKHIGSNVKTNITFNLVNKDNFDTLMGYPFHNGDIGGTNVTIIPKSNILGCKYVEYYANDKNTFNLTIDYDLSTSYKMGLLETCNGVTTGEYLLNPDYTNGVYKGTVSGIFISKPHTNESKTYNVTLKGSYSPNL